ASESSLPAPWNACTGSLLSVIPRAFLLAGIICITPSAPFGDTRFLGLLRFSIIMTSLVRPSGRPNALSVSAARPSYSVGLFMSTRNLAISIYLCLLRIRGKPPSCLLPGCWTYVVPCHLRLLWPYWCKSSAQHSQHS